MEVREAYLEEFDYSRMAEVAGRETREANMRLMRRAAMASLQVGMGPGRHRASMSGTGLRTKDAALWPQVAHVRLCGWLRRVKLPCMWQPGGRALGAGTGSWMRGVGSVFGTAR